MTSTKTIRTETPFSWNRGIDPTGWNDNSISKTGDDQDAAEVPCFACSTYAFTATGGFYFSFSMLPCLCRHNAVSVFRGDDPAGQR
jgi:hypothetical protein